MASQARSTGLPDSWRILSGSSLKVIASIIMLIDHINHHLLSHLPIMRTVLTQVGTIAITPSYLLSSLGRWAFPLYCFLLVEGYRHTHDVRRYVQNLLLFALVSEIPWDLEHGGTLWMPQTQNVFFTLELGLLALIVVGKLQESARDATNGLRALVLLALIGAASLVLHADYGIRGVLLVLALYVLWELPLLRAVAGCAILRAHLRALPAFGLMELYNGERGFIRGNALKFAFYAFYPLHILVIALIKMHLGYV